MHITRFILTAGLVAAICTGAPREAVSQTPAPTAITLPSGAYLIALTDTDNVPSGMVGQYQLVFDPTGKYRVVRDGRELVLGTYTVRGDTLTLVDVSGQIACLGIPEATYLWKLGEKGLEMVAVSDPCEGRRLFTTIHPMARAKAD